MFGKRREWLIYKYESCENYLYAFSDEAQVLFRFQVIYEQALNRCLLVIYLSF